MKRSILLAVLLFSFSILPVRGQAVELNLAGKSALLMDVNTGTIL